MINAPNVIRNINSLGTSISSRCYLAVLRHAQAFPAQGWIRQQPFPTAYAGAFGYMHERERERARASEQEREREREREKERESTYTNTHTHTQPACTSVEHIENDSFLFSPLTFFLHGFVLPHPRLPQEHVLVLAAHGFLYTHILISTHQGTHEAPESQ